VIFGPELQPHAVESFWPTSVIGWLTFATLATAVGKTGYDWFTGRRKSIVALDKKMDDVCGKIEDMEGKLIVVDGLSRSVGELVFEWRGVDGTNGYKSIIKRHDREILAIQRRNVGIDAVREEDERRSGGQHRRHMDRVLEEDKEENNT
jgi:hypothetical protein